MRGIMIRPVIATALAAGLTVSACAEMQPSQPSQPTSPSFVVVSTDWHRTVSQPGRPAPRACPQQDPSALPAVCPINPGLPPRYQFTAHGVFRNQGASGSAVVTFSDQQRHSCNTVVNAQAGQVIEASCPMFEDTASGQPSPPIATVRS